MHLASQLKSATVLCSCIILIQQILLDLWIVNGSTVHANTKLLQRGGERETGSCVDP